ncbi:MAG: hypothetical protein JKY02_10865 [Flavobacteriaceae bacterium]|nr:hypothetical protein [Flavobacteriaceae bacterium]
MNKKTIKNYVQLGILLFGISVLLWSCEKEETFAESEIQQETKVKRVSLSDFKSKVLLNEKFEKLEKYFYSNVTTQSKTSDDTNSLTAEWTDLFNMWLFELGPSPINFQNNDATTISLQTQEGVIEARGAARLLVSQGNFNIPTHSWQYGQQEFYDGIVGGNIATAFLGSYTTSITAGQNANGTVTYTFTVENTSGWASASRLRIDNDGDGTHDAIISNKNRGVGILLGGNFEQEWTWSETY